MISRHTIFSFVSAILVSTFSIVIANAQESFKSPGVHNMDTGEDFYTITEAIDDADTLDGHTIQVDPGTYNESLNINKQLTIKSTSGDPNDTVIKSFGQLVVVLDAQGIVLNALTVEGYQYGKGIGVYESYCAVSDCIIRNCFDGVVDDSMSASKYLSLINNIIENNLYKGVQLYSRNNTIQGNTIRYNGSWGINLNRASYTSISMNVIEGNQYGGIHLYLLTDCEVIGNTIKDNNGKGLQLDDSRSCTISGNAMSGNTFNFGVYSSFVEADFYHSVDSTNTVEGKPVYYYVNQQNIQVPSDAGFIAVVDCENVTAGSMTLSDNGSGLLLVDSNNCSFQEMNLLNNIHGIYMRESDYNTFSEIEISVTDQNGIHVRDSRYNSFESCDVTQCSESGIKLFSSRDTEIIDCFVQDSSDKGIEVEYSFNTLIQGSVIRDHGHGGIFLGGGSVSSRIMNNVIEDNQSYGITINSSPQNQIIDNIIQRTSYQYYKAILFLYDSHGTTIKGNEIREGCRRGIYISDSNNCVIEENLILNHDDDEGVHLVVSESAKVRRNTLSGNRVAMQLDDSNSNEIIGNIISESETGMVLNGSSHNDLMNNTCLDCSDIELTLEDSQYNKIYHNDFLTESLVVYDYNLLTNIWDNGYPSGGNYWGNYQGGDLDGDGIGDIPVEILPVGNNNYDLYPLMIPANLTLFADKDSISESTGGQVNMSIEGGLGNAFRKYLVVGGISGTDPGQPLPGGLATLPVNFDAFTYHLVFPYMNTGLFADFMGVLDEDGRANPVLNAPPVTGFAGNTMHFAFCCNNPFDFASNNIAVTVIP